MQTFVHTVKIVLACIAVIFSNASKAQLNCITQPDSKFIDKTVLDIAFGANPPDKSSSYQIGYLAMKTLKQRLDSSIIEKFDIINNRYDKDGKHVYTYDDYGNCILVIHSMWVGQIGSWLKQFKDVAVFGSNGNKTLDEHYDWDNNSNDWKGTIKEEYAFDSVGNLLTKQYGWNDSIGQWNEPYLHQSIKSFNDKNQLILQIDSWWDKVNIKWNSFKKTELSYDAKNRMISNSICYWHIGSTGWNNAYKIQYTYDFKGNPLTQTDYTGTSSGWIESRKLEHTYDTNNNLIQYIFSDWNTISNSWRLSGKIEKTNDAYNNLISELLYSMNPTNNEWDITSKNLYTYDNTFVNTDIVQPPYYSNYYKHLLKDYYRHVIINNSWNNNLRQTFYYSQNNFTGISENKLLLNAIIYPNPTSGLITVISILSPITNITVYDLTGNSVYTIKNNQIQNSVQLDLSSLNNGIYFMNIQNENGQLKTFKIILAK